MTISFRPTGLFDEDQAVRLSAENVAWVAQTAGIKLETEAGADGEMPAIEFLAAMTRLLDPPCPAMLSFHACQLCRVARTAIARGIPTVSWS